MSNMAGIVPISGHDSDITLPWHHVMMPYDKNKTLVQNAVYTCAMAGCKSIWLICNHDMQPVIKSILGDSIEDPVYKFRPHARYASDHKKHIPIFYAPLPLRDLKNKDNVAWSAVFGCLLAKKVYGQISTYTAPDRYFISWPYALLNNSVLRDHRRLLAKEDLFLASEGKSMATDDFLPLCFSASQLQMLKEHCYDLSNPHADNKPFKEILISEVFAPMLNKRQLELDLEYKRVGSWKDYCSIFK
jgi:hypothetical protein